MGDVREKWGWIGADDEDVDSTVRIKKVFCWKVLVKYGMMDEGSKRF